MTKENNAAKWVSNHGVKIYSPKSSGYWRVVWTEDGKTKDTTAKNEAEALSKASGIEMRLMTPNGRLSMLSIKDMYKAYADVYVLVNCALETSDDDEVSYEPLNNGNPYSILQNCQHIFVSYLYLEPAFLS
jgi:hypothetical protein